MNLGYIYDKLGKSQDNVKVFLKIGCLTRKSTYIKRGSATTAIDKQSKCKVLMKYQHEMETRNMYHAQHHQHQTHYKAKSRALV